jgi:hypothetical protein
MHKFSFRVINNGVTRITKNHLRGVRQIIYPTQLGYLNTLCNRVLFILGHPKKNIVLIALINHIDFPPKPANAEFGRLGTGITL